MSHGEAGRATAGAGEKGRATAGRAMAGSAVQPQLAFNARLASRSFDVQLDIPDGETVAVMGPNGAGKSTLLSLLAGLVKPDDGAATLAGLPLFDDRTFTPPHRRGVCLLAQEPALFPHLSVLENVAFGPRSAGVGRRESRLEAQRWLAKVDATVLAARKPAQLSGGQAQRIAVARALAAGPELLLLDEPMAALDVTVAPMLRRTLRTVLRDRTAIIVTHDVLDALILADRIVVLDGGTIVEQGRTRDVLERPRSAFAAGLAGLNLLTGTAGASGSVATPGAANASGVVATPGTANASGVAGVASLTTAGGLSIYGLPSGFTSSSTQAGTLASSAHSAGPGHVNEPGQVGEPVQVAEPVQPAHCGLPAGLPAAAVFSPRSVSVFTQPPGEGSPRNVFPVRITDLEPRGGLMSLRAVPLMSQAPLAAELTIRSAADLDLVPGMEVYFAVKATEVTLYPL